jgi:hypothetical protein
MKKKDPKEKISDLLRKNLTRDEKKMAISELKAAGMGEDELESVAKVNRLIDEMPVEDPSSAMDSKFYEMLEEERNKVQVPGKSISESKRSWASSFGAGLRIAAGIALFLLGWFTASWWGQRSGTSGEMALLSDELSDIKETLVLTMMHQNSTLERIKAVNMVDELGNPDKRIIESLLGALNHDDNDNVRLLSLEALIRYSDNPAVREGLVASIRNQTSPMIQLRLAEVMVALNEKNAAAEFQKVLMDAGLNYSVRNKINEAVTVLL